MNTAFQAKDGLSPAFFPADVPIFSGHYHIPHVVDNSNIRYIGSPYQGEACRDAYARASAIQCPTDSLEQRHSKPPVCSDALQLCRGGLCLAPAAAYPSPPRGLHQSRCQQPPKAADSCCSVAQ